MITREGYMVGLLPGDGASVNDGNAATLQCLAKDVRDEPLRRCIASPSRELDCEGVPLPWKLN